MFLYGELATRPEHAERASSGAAAPASWRGGSRTRSSSPTTGRTGLTPAPAPSWPARGRRSWRSTWTWRRRISRPRARSPRPARIRRGLPGGAGDRPLPRGPRARPGVDQRARPSAVPLREIVAYVAERAEIAEAELIGRPAGRVRGLPGGRSLRDSIPSGTSWRTRWRRWSRVQADGADQAESALASIAAPRPARSSAPAGPVVPRRDRTRSGSRASAARSGSTGSPIGGARSTAPRSRPRCSESC